MALQYDFETTRRATPLADLILVWSQKGVDPAEAWDSLLRGDWVVAEHSTNGSARNILARSAPDCSSEEALCTGEVRAATRRAGGDVVKAIAIDLGCTEARVHRSIASVMRKLKMKCQADLVALLRGGAPWGLTASRVRSGPEEFLVLTYPIPFWPLPPCLTRAEQGIVMELVAGASQTAIAKARGTSVRTVANQIASIFRKLKVGSRIELFVALRPS